MTSKPRSSQRWRRWGVVVVLVLFVVEIAWLVSAHVILNTEFLQRRLNRHPEKLVLEWKSGRSFVPWRIRVEGVTVRGQGRRDQWYGEADHVDIHVRLRSLVQKRVVTDLVRIDGVAFRLRPRLDAVPPGSVDAAHLPDIPGLANPPEVSPTFPTNVPVRKRWTLDLRGIDLRNVREIWIKDSRIVGPGVLRGQMQHEIRGPFTALVDEFHMPAAAVTLAGVETLTGANIRLKGQLGPLRFKVHRGVELWERTTAESQVDSGFAGLTPLLRALGAPEDLVVVGAGRLTVNARVAEGSVESRLERLEIPAGFIRYQGEPVATNLHLNLSGQLEPGSLRELRGTNLIELLNAQVEMNGDLLSADLYTRHLGRVKSIHMAGGGRLDARAGLARGEFQPGSRIRLQSPDLQVRFVNVTAIGNSEVNVDVAESIDGVTSTMSVALKALRFRHLDDLAEIENAGNVRLTAIAYDPSLVDGFRDVALDLEVGPFELPDTRFLNAFIPTNSGLSFLSGTFRVGASYHDERQGRGVGSLVLDGDGVEFRLGDRDYSGRFDASARYLAETNHVVHLDQASVVVTNVMISGIRNRQPDGWHARVTMDHGTVALDGSKTLEGDIAVELLDIRPLLALLREQGESADWAKWVPNLKELRGGASVRVAPNSVGIRDLALRAKATEVLGQLGIEQGEPEGVLYVRYGIISAGFDFRGDKKSWTILGAKRAYKRALEEMGIQSRVEPEGEE